MFVHFFSLFVRCVFNSFHLFSFLFISFHFLFFVSSILFISVYIFSLFVHCVFNSFHFCLFLFTFCSLCLQFFSFMFISFHFLFSVLIYFHFVHFFFISCIFLLLKKIPIHTTCMSTHYLVLLKYSFQKMHI